MSMTKDDGLAKYIRIILNSKFPQCRLLNVRDFQRFLAEREIRITKEDLEYYDEKEIFRPILRLHKRLAAQGPLKYEMVMTDIFSIQQYSKLRLVEIPKNNDFKPWEGYRDNFEEKTIQFYHPFQLLQVVNLTIKGTMLGPMYIENVTSAQSHTAIMFEKERLQKTITKRRDINIKEWVPIIGLLLLLEEAYALQTRGYLSSNIMDENFFKDWTEWRISNFTPESILKNTDLKLEKIKEVHYSLAAAGRMVDPLWNWFVLLQIIDRSMKLKLEGKALLAQEYYELCQMLSFFIYDLTKEKMLDPDDLRDGRHGSWKPRIYGSPFDYNTVQTQQLILRRFLLNRPKRMAIVFEGYTEEFIIKSIFESLYIDLDRNEYVLYNAKGQGNLNPGNLDGLITIGKNTAIDVFVIIDNEAEAEKILEQHIKNGNIKADMAHKWNRDFEYDNFGIDLVVDRVNDLLREQGFICIDRLEVDSRMSRTNCALINCVANIVGKYNHGIDFYKNISSKVKLAQSLISDRLMEIRQEREGEGWKPKLPIEIVLKKIFYKSEPIFQDNELIS